jgi:hypothetical protein
MKLASLGLDLDLDLAEQTLFWLSFTSLGRL